MDVIGRSAPMVALRAEIARLAPLDTPVLITGEPGTGKDLVASAIHKAGPRAGRRLLTVEVDGLPASQLDVELLQAQGSTVLFCQVQRWPREWQPTLRHLLRERARARSGATPRAPVDVRVIVTTDTDPDDLLVAEGPVSEALDEAPGVDTIHVPPLRDRREDVPLLARYFLDRSARQYRKDITGLVPEALSILTRHPWPGNVRELTTVIERAVVFATTKRITPDDVAYLLQETTR
jgi:two-component system response regulator GlrR